jgi:hypothetical protein
MFLISGCRRSYITLNSSLVNDLVDVVSSDPRLCRSSCNVQNLAPEATHLAHRILLLLVQNSNLVPVDKDLLRARYAIFCVIWVPYVLRDFASRREGVYGSEGSGVRVRGEWVIVAGGWIRVRNYFRRKDVLENTTL